MKIPNGKVLAHLRFKWKILPEPLTDLRARMVFCTSSPQQGFKYHDIWKIICGKGVCVCSMHIPWQILSSKDLAHLGFKSKGLRGSLTNLNAWFGFCTSSTQQGVKYQLWYLKCFFVEREWSVQISHEKSPTEKFLSTWGLGQRFCSGL